MVVNPISAGTFFLEDISAKFPHDCWSEYIITPSTLSLQSYLVGSGSDTISFLDFTLNETCTDAVFEYSASMTSPSIGSLPGFISLTGKTFSLSTSSNGDRALYDILVKGTLNNG